MPVTLAHEAMLLATSMAPKPIIFTQTFTSKICLACAFRQPIGKGSPSFRIVSWLLQRCLPRRSFRTVRIFRISLAKWDTYMPCLLTRTAYVSGYSSIALSRLPVRSSSKAVFSMIGMRRVSWKPSIPGLSRPCGIPLICSM